MFVQLWCRRSASVKDTFINYCKIATIIRICAYIIHTPTSQLWHIGKCCNPMYNMHLIYHSCHDGWWQSCLLFSMSKTDYEMACVIIIIHHCHPASSLCIIVFVCHCRMTSSCIVVVTLRVFDELHVIMLRCALLRVVVIVRFRSRCHA